MHSKTKRFLSFSSIAILVTTLTTALSFNQFDLKRSVVLTSTNSYDPITLHTSTPLLLTPPQPVWQRLNYSTLPSGRLNSSLTYNPINQIALLFGGRNSTAGFLNELWLTNGRDWMLFYTPHSPPERLGANMVYDEDRQGAILYGGQNETMWFDDTWFFNGVDWIQQEPVDSPSARLGGSMAYDAERKVTILFGGLSTTNGNYEDALDDMWVWNGENWQQQFPAVLPPNRFGANMVYDRARKNIVLYGGAIGGGILNDTWIWDGTSWVEQHPLHHPIRLRGFGMAFDETLQQVVLFGKATSAETWTWDGQDWTQLHPHDQLPEELVEGAQLVYLPELQTVMLFGDYRWKTDDPEAEIHFGEFTEVWALAYQYFMHLPTVYHSGD